MKLKDLPTKYDFNSVECGKYQKWIENGYFTAGDVTKKPFTIVIPPPNITGKLHLGHVLDTTLQDIIIRRKRMQGFDALYLPGTDHASIATQAKVEAELRTKGITRYDLGRERFLEICWKWKDKYVDLIRKQWAVIGLSLDYSRERFTLDEGLNRAVNEVFIRMYNEGLIYRGEKIINWDIQSKTALSNIEVDYHEVDAALYYITYPFAAGRSGGLTVATTRPETMFGDVALMVNPKDKRYRTFIGREVIIPETSRKIPVISDDFVDIEFGTGVVKVTPAHDSNDFEVGLRHNLPMPLCMNEDGTMNEMAGKYQGMERFACRAATVKALQASGNLKKIEKIVHAVGHSERTGVIVEPRLSKQWFVAMDCLAKKLLEMQKSTGKINFIPARFEKTFTDWLIDIQDWCISRQLWWGHRIPAWYRDDEVYVGHKAPEGAGWHQDEDALDTWFSSALWPFSTLGWPDETSDLNRYFPTDVLITAYDIIFFWVARMAFQSKYLLGVRPFRDVLIHGLIRDEFGRKVSKSLGNSIDMLEVRNQYGMDSLRYFLSTTSTPGQDIRFSEEKVEAAWNYINKIWNISRYIGLNFDAVNYDGCAINLEALSIIDQWILNELNELITAVDDNFEKYEFGEAAKMIYKFVWQDFASWYLELTKVVFLESDSDEKQNTCSVLSYVLVATLKMLHPFMPFVTEEIYQRFNKGSITVSNWPEAEPCFSFPEAHRAEILFNIITAIRGVRADKNVSYRQLIDLEIQARDEATIDIITANLRYLQKFVNYRTINVGSEEIDANDKVITVLSETVVAVPMAQLVNIEEEIAKLKENLIKMEKEITRCKKMLENPNFLKKAPTAKVALEREKMADYQKQKEEIEKIIADYQK
ncbi:MAG: valine--tRNA ligase [Bacilli bacterium]|nr:valine--tRNA ligase [Bacilli bacterium]